MELSKKHKSVKNEFTRWCKTKALDFLKPLIEKIRRDINQEEFADFDSFRVAIDELKDDYKLNGPKFSTCQELIEESCGKLAMRAVEMWTVHSKKHLENTNRFQDIKISDLVDELKEKKAERTHEKQQQDYQLQIKEIQKNDLIKNLTLAEERLKKVQEEHDKATLHHRQSLEAKEIKLQHTEEAHRVELQEMKSDIRQKEEDFLRQVAQ